MSNVNLPKWYVQALNNKSFFDGDTFDMLLQDGIEEYNRALKDGDPGEFRNGKNMF